MKQKKSTLDVMQLMGIALVFLVLGILVLFYQGKLFVGWTAWWELVGVDTLYVIGFVALVLAVMCYPIIKEKIK